MGNFSTKTKYRGTLCLAMLAVPKAYISFSSDCSLSPKMIQAQISSP